MSMTTPDATPLDQVGGTPCKGQGRVSSDSTDEQTEEGFVNQFRSGYGELRDSLPHGSCAPQGDGALRRAGGAV
jgi:hypothetical protein